MTDAAAKKPSFLLLATGNTVTILAVLGILIAINVIVAHVRLRADMTEEKLYTLSDGSKNTLAKLDNEVTLKFFFNRSNAEVPIFLKRYAKQVEDLLREYELASGGKVVIETYDPKPDSDAEQWAQQYGIAGQPIDLSGNRLYLGLAAEVGDTIATIGFLDPRTENRLEYDITRMISRIANPGSIVVGVLSGLPIMGSAPPQFAMPGQPRPPQRPAWAAIQSLKQDYEVREVPPTADRIDDDINVLLLFQPKELGDSTLYAIDQYVLGGGSLMAYMDPLCLADEAAAASPFGGPPPTADLGRLFDAWGVRYEPGKLAADRRAATRINAGDRIEDSLVFLTIRKENINSNDITTAELENMMVPMGGSFTVEAGDELTVTPLIQTSTDSQAVDAMAARFGSDAMRREFKSGMARLNLALRLHGKLETAFPDGKPAGEEDGEDGGAIVADEGLKESVDTSTIVLVGDADMLADRFCVQQIPTIFGGAVFQSVNDNLSFFINTVEQLAGSADLVGIRSRGKMQRPFEVVLQRKAEAQERWQQEEQQLQASLEAANRRMSELQAEKSASQKFILSDEQKQIRDRARDEVSKIEGELREVRKKLREDIERLGVRVKAVNILLVPFLVTGCGIVFAAYRRTRRRN